MKPTTSGAKTRSSRSPTMLHGLTVAPVMMPLAHSGTATMLTSCSTMVKDTAIATSARLASSQDFRQAGPPAAIITSSTPSRAWAVSGNRWQIPMATSGASPEFSTTAPASSQTLLTGSRICLTLKVMPKLVTSVSKKTVRPALNIALGFAGDLAAQQRPPVGVLVDAGGLFGQRFFPPQVEGEHADGEADDEGDPGGPPGVEPGGVADQPDQAGERGDGDEPFAADELLGGHAAGDVDVPPAGGRADDRQRQHPKYRQVRLFGGLGAGDRVPGQGEGGHELEQSLAEQLAGGEGDQVADDPGRQAQQDVGRVGERARDLVQYHVAGDAAADAAQQCHQQDADDREVLVVVGPAGQQRAVQRVGRRRDQVDRGEVTGPLEPADGDPGGDDPLACHGSFS